MGEHNLTLKHRHFEKVRNKIVEMNTENEDDQVQSIINSTLKNPTQSHPIGLQKELFKQSEGKLSNCLTQTKIQNTLYNLRKDFFLPTTEIKSIKFIKTYSGESLCPQVNLADLFLIIN